MAYGGRFRDTFSFTSSTRSHWQLTATITRYFPYLLAFRSHELVDALWELATEPFKIVLCVDFLSNAPKACLELLLCLFPRFLW